MNRAWSLIRNTVCYRCITELDKKSFTKLKHVYHKRVFAVARK